MEPVTRDGLGRVRDRRSAVCTGLAGRLAVGDAVFRKGVDYLMRTQASDGSWQVRSRAIWFQPYFESGFPYGQDQFISSAGTAWAVLALTVATEADKQTRR